MTEPFNTIAIGTNFVWHNVEYSKIADERISCCKVLNAVRLDSGEKIMIAPIENVEVKNSNENQ